MDTGARFDDQRRRVAKPCTDAGCEVDPCTLLTGERPGSVEDRGSGRMSRSFFSSTIDSVATSCARRRIAGLRVSLRSARASIDRYGSSNSPSASFSVSTRRTA